MSKARIIITAVIEYEIDTSNYEPGKSPEECLESDLSLDPDEIIESFDDKGIKWSVEGELLIPEEVLPSGV